MKKLFFSLALILMTSCEYGLENGIVPSEYLDQARFFEGTYSGTFGKNVTGQLHIQLNGNKPSLDFKGEDGHGILGSTCESSFGNVLNYEYDSKKKRVESFTVEVIHNCSSLDFDQMVLKVNNRGLQLQMLKQRLDGRCQNREVAIPSAEMSAMDWISADMSASHGSSSGLGARADSIRLLHQLTRMPEFCFSYYAGEFTKE